MRRTVAPSVRGMTTANARAPEDVDVLLEDAFVLRDVTALDGVFADGAVLVDGDAEARGRAAIALLLAGLWTRDRTYVASVRRIVRTGDTALVLADAGLHVLRRDGDGSWRSAISLLRLDPSSERRHP